MLTRRCAAGRAWCVMMMFVVSVCALSATPAVAQDARAALNAASADADVVILAPRMSRLADDIATLRAAIGLPMPELEDPLATFKQDIGVTEGVNDDGSMLLIMPDLAEAIRAGAEPEFLMLVPVTDFDAFLGNFEGAERVGDGLSAIELPDGQMGFVREANGFAVMGPQRARVEGYAPGEAADAMIQSVGSMGERFVGGADLMVYVNIERIAPAAIEALDRMMAEQRQQAQEDAEFMDPLAMANFQAVLDIYGGMARSILDDGTGLLLSLDLDDRGIGMTHSLGFKPGSALAQVFPGNNQKAVGLTQLPDQPFIFAMSFDARAVDLPGLYRKMIEQMPAEGNPMLQDADAWMPLMQNIRHMAMAFYAPTEMAMMSGSMLNTLTVIETDDAADYKNRLRTLMQQMNDMEVPVGENMMNPDAGPMTITYTTAYNQNVLQLDGVQVDQFQVTANMPQELMAQMGPAAGFMGMFSNYSGYVAERDGRVLITTVPDPQLVTRGFQAIAQGGGLGAAGAIGRIREQALPPNASMEGYLSLGGIAESANMFLGMLGVPPIQVPANLPPLASGLGVQGNSAACRVYLPLETVRFVVDTSQLMMQQMMGPQQGPGGPPPF
jgi:hypothetical protein